MTDDNEQDSELLKKELVGLFGHIQRIRRELAALDSRASGEDHFSGINDQLDAIIVATEQATNTIMESVEEIDQMVADARSETDEAKRNEILDGVAGRIGNVFEACSFQDITGQRITKVVNSLKFVEERVNRVLIMWGREELEKLVDAIEEERKRAEVDPDKALLSGPALPGMGVTQNEVDQVFSQADIDKLFS